MAKEDTKKVQSENIDNQPIEVVEPVNDPTPLQPTNNIEAFAQGISPYVKFLEAMRVTKKHRTTAPTFTPKNFYEQIQFYDTGGVRRLYLYINGSWRYVVLT